MEDVEYVANMLIGKFLRKGVIVHKKVSNSTNSIYIKLDYGLGRTIRISDHYKSSYRFYYNVVKGYRFCVKRKRGRDICFFPLSRSVRVNNRIKRKVLSDKYEKIGKMGIEEYNRLLEERKRKSKYDGSMKGYRRVYEADGRKDGSSVKDTRRVSKKRFYSSQV